MDSNNYIIQEQSNDLVDWVEDDSQEFNQFGTTKYQRDKTYKKDLYNNANSFRQDQHENYYEESFPQISPFPIDLVQDSVEVNQSFINDEGKKKRTLKYPQVWIKQPGETKNMPKCFGRQLQNMMKIIKDNTKDPQIKEMFQKTDVKKFFRTKSDDIGKKKLDDFIQSEAGQIIAQDFFGNCRWIYGLVKENKTNVESYFRHNKIYFYETQKAKKTKLN